MTDRRPSLPFAVPLLAVPRLAVFGLALLLAGCAGYNAMQQARAMPPHVVARQSDEFVCQRLRSFGYAADVPVTWLREAQRRNLQSCIDQGMAQRRSDDANRARFGCDRFSPFPWDRCW